MQEMSFNNRLRIAGAWILVVSLLFGAWFAYLFVSSRDLAVYASSADFTWTWARHDSRDLSLDASVFRKEQGEPISSSSGPLSKRFRLAGTFLADGVNQRARLAVIDVVALGEQQLVSEGGVLEKTVLVKAVFRDRVVLCEGREDEDIWLSFAGADGGQVSADAVRTDINRQGAEGVLGRFGRRVGDKRWVLNRNAVLAYYSELLDDTERLANVFDSMKPVYEGETIQGYVLDVRGEGEVFEAFGLAPGDIVRKVNSMPMTSRIRAEYFIREFVADRANAFVLDVERGGKIERLIYMVR